MKYNPKASTIIKAISFIGKTFREFVTGSGIQKVYHTEVKYNIIQYNDDHNLLNHSAYISHFGFSLAPLKTFEDRLILFYQSMQVMSKE